MLTIVTGLAASLLLAGPANDRKNEAASERKPASRTVDTRSFTLQIPSGWSISEETPWGSRDIRPDGADSAEGASMSSMTGPGLGRQSWQRLYETSLYFITRYDRERKLKATQYTIGKSKLGFETCSWDMKDDEDRVLQRHVILKHENGNILALSVKFPKAVSSADRAKLDRSFRHMLDTAVVK